MKQSYSVLLYYCYTTIKNPEEFREKHHLFCLEKGLRGRIIIAHEGINGTLSGCKEACMQYMDALKKSPQFAHTHFKVESCHQHAFQKLNIRIKPEIVHAGLPHIRPDLKTGQYIMSQELQRMRTEEDVVLLDVRSNYEHKLGRFKGAVTLDINYFREFPDQVASLASYKKKKVITYCTGGIRCEKASAYLLEQGFQQVYQLYGGIIQHGLETSGEDFEGKCYVFDNRLSIAINKKNPTVVSQCYVCHAACDRMVNCANPKCNIHVPLCEPCAETLAGSCSETCQQHPSKRPYDGTGYYTTKMNGYNPYKGLRRSSLSLVEAGNNRTTLP